MIHKSDLHAFITDVEFKFVMRDGAPVFYYRIKKGDSFRDWSQWIEIKEAKDERDSLHGQVIDLQKRLVKSEVKDEVLPRTNDYLDY